jgi:ZIP family zinc transporter
LVSIGVMGAAFGWGAVAASSLVLGMSLGLLRPWPNRLIGLVLAFGAGALVSAVSFELFEEGVQVGGAAAVGIGLGVGRSSTSCSPARWRNSARAAARAGRR